MAKQKRSNRPGRDSRSRDFTPTRKRTRVLDPNDIVDINDVEFLRRFVTEYGKIIPARLTGVTAACSARSNRACRARNMGLMA